MNEYFDILSTDYEGRRPSIMFSLRQPVRAAKVYRFVHREDGSGLHVFADSKGSPLAVQFRELIPVDGHTLLKLPPLGNSPRECVLKLAKFMIAYFEAEGAIEAVDATLIEDQESNSRPIPTPDLPLVRRAFNDARLQLVGAG